MNNHTIKKARCLWLFVVSICTVISVQCMAQVSPEDSWQELFNGEDLTGWEMLNGQHKAEVIDGGIAVTTVYGEPNGFLCTTEEYGDFILELEVKTDLLLDNSGIQFRSLSHEDYRDGRIHGYQAQIENRPPHVSQWNGAIYDEARRGWLYILEDDPLRQKAYTQNQWNHYRIEAIGTTNRVWVNGIPTAHLVDKETISTDHRSDEKTTHGLICLQVHGGAHSDIRGSQSVYMRNVRLQTDNLQPSSYDDIPVLNLISNSLSGQEEYQGFELLFDGETAKNWRGISQSTLPETGWDIDDGMLTIYSSKEGTSGNGEGIMMTEKPYGSFELKFEFRQPDEEAIAGIEYLVQESQGESVFGKLASFREETKSPGEWNRGRIKVHPDNLVEYWLNGYKILEYQRDSNASSDGHILLADYGSAISYRSIKIRELH